MTVEGLFGAVDTFPNERARERFEALVGVDFVSDQIIASVRAQLDPNRVEVWSKKHHGDIISAVREVADLIPLVVLAGDVGTGKTELAETIGDPIARTLEVEVTMYPLSLSARGHGAVGEMTTLISSAFQSVADAAESGRGRDGRLRHITILLIDEADALAQSRELAQMHHEDRAGVNALIRGINELQRDRLPVLTIMCTNRMSAIDPAVLRRAVATFEFDRPDLAQRTALLRRLFSGVKDVSTADIAELAKLTGEREDRRYGCTYSDLRQRFVPLAVIQAVDADEPITGKQLIANAHTFQPTRPFDSEQGGAA